MNRIVIRKLIIQIIIVFIILLIPYLIVNRVFGTKTIISVIALSPQNNSKEIISIAKIEKGNNSLRPQAIVTTSNGYVLFEKEGYLNTYRISENKVLLFHMDTTQTKRSLFLLNTDTYLLSELSDQTTLPSDPLSTLTINSNSRTNSFCFYYKKISYKVSCFEYEEKNNKIIPIDTKEVNELLTNIKSNKYFLESNYGYFLETNTYKKSEYVISYSNDLSRIQPVNLLSFKVENSKLVILSNNFKDHVIDSEDMKDNNDNSYEINALGNITPITLISRVQSDGIIYSTEPNQAEELNNIECYDVNFKCPYISNPIIGSQFIEYKGVKYLEWLSTYNYSSVQAGILGNNKTIYARINNNVYLIDIKTRIVYKLNSKEDFTNTIVIGVGYY